MPKFESNTGGHVSIYVDWRSAPIEVQAEGDYETDDKREVQALRDCPEVSEVKEAKAQKQQKTVASHRHQKSSDK